MTVIVIVTTVKEVLKTQNVCQMPFSEEKALKV